tara:strand:- start:1197 stop:1907 length:711 start_codon:yes stop_codon:yes gene_type:complete
MNNKIKKSPLKITGNPAVDQAIIGVGINLVGKLFGRGKRRRQARQTREAEAEFEELIQEYKDSKFQPIDPNLADQENIFEDMEIDTTSFELQRKAFLQQQANILQGLQMVGGTSGAASLATALSVAGSKQAEQTTMTISEAINRAKELRLQEESRINESMTNIKIANAEGARQFEMDKLSTLLSIQGQKLSGIRSHMAAKRAQTGQILGMVGEVAGGYLAGGGDFSKIFKPTPSSD